jgi:hypothetical protein
VTGAPARPAPASDLGRCTPALVVDPVATLRRWSPADAPRNWCDGTGLKCFPENVIVTVAFRLSNSSTATTLPPPLLFTTFAPISCEPSYLLLVVVAWVVEAAISCAKPTGALVLSPTRRSRGGSLPCSSGRTDGPVLQIGRCSW